MRRLLTPGWLACHVLMVTLVVGMLWLAGWQLSRAAGGNALSWGYAFQWPVFAGFVVFVWVREVRRSLRRTPTAPGERLSPEQAIPQQQPAARAAPAVATGRPVVTRRPATVPTGDETAGDPDLVAYNNYLAWLSANPDARPVDYPG